MERRLLSRCARQCSNVGFTSCLLITKNVASWILDNAPSDGNLKRVMLERRIC